jgi:hypothetical protein
MPGQVAKWTSGKFAQQSVAALRCESLLEEWSRYTELKAKWNQLIEVAVAADEQAARLMQVMGIGPVAAHTLRAFIGDIRRFETPGQLVAYVGFNPVVCQSGEGKSRGAMTRHGRGDLKWLLIEAAHNALIFGKDPMHAWARSLVKKGKPRHVATCALARKMLVAAWHILMGHPPLNPSASANHCRKLTKVARSADRIGQLAPLGYPKVKDYVLHLSAQTASPPRLPRLQKARVRGELPGGGLSPATPPQNNTSTSKSRKL